MPKVVFVPAPSSPWPFLTVHLHLSTRVCGCISARLTCLGERLLIAQHDVRTGAHIPHTRAQMQTPRAFAVIACRRSFLGYEWQKIP